MPAHALTKPHLHADTNTDAEMFFLSQAGPPGFFTIARPGPTLYNDIAEVTCIRCYRANMRQRYSAKCGADCQVPIPISVCTRHTVFASGTDIAWRVLPVLQ